MKIWVKTDGPVREGKYLVVRRDGTIPEWPPFVFGGYDPCVPAALKEYAKTARLKGYDPEYCASIEELAYDFERLSATEHARRVADPDAGPHRTDNPAVIEMMRGNSDMASYIRQAESALAEAREKVAGLEAALEAAEDFMSSYRAQYMTTTGQVSARAPMREAAKKMNAALCDARAALSSTKEEDRG